MPKPSLTLLKNMVFKVGDLQYFHTNFDKFERTMFPAGHAHIQFFNASPAISESE
jgi:hypothetical protein